MTATVDMIRADTARFMYACYAGGEDYCLTPRAEPTAYARCFAVFLMKFLHRVPDDIVPLAQALKNDLHAMRARSDVDIKGKSYRQLLAFTLSAIAALGVLSEEPLADLVAEQIPRDVERELMKFGCLVGKAGSGNQAMFLAIFLLHGRGWLGLDTQSRIDEWVDLHLEHMNRFGFWGQDRGMTHLQFQNGYHQHEILEYLGVENPRSEAAVSAVRALADDQGHFAPYSGGGGCYDYDAVFMLTPGGKVPNDETRALLERTAATLISEQRADGGFAESLYVRPRTPANLWRTAVHIGRAAGNMPLFLERLRYGLTLQRPAHDRIHTHWSRYSRRWDESDLWDSWFRLLTLARIQVAIEPERAGDWGFCDYPGIGFHPSVRSTKPRF